MKITSKLLSGILSFALSLHCVTFGLTAYAEDEVIEDHVTESVVHEYSFDGKTMGDVSGFVSYGKDPAYPAEYDITHNGLTVMKHFSGANYAVNAAAEVKFKRNIEEYSEETRSYSCQESFKGKYHITVPVLVWDNHRLTLTRLLLTNSAGVHAPAFVRTAWNTMYVDGGPTLISSMTAGNFYNIDFELDTRDPNSFTVSADGSEKYNIVSSELGNDTAITGFSFGFYNYGEPSNMSCSGFKIVDLDPDENENMLEEATKRFDVNLVCDDPLNVTSSLTLPKEFEGYSIKWSSDKPKVISEKGVVVLPEDSDEDVWLKAIISDGFYERVKYFKLTVPRDQSVLPRLNQPTAPIWNGNIVSWDAVKDATSYEVTVLFNGRASESFVVSENTIDMQPLMKTSGFYSVKTVAIADGYRDSEISPASSYFRYISDSEELMFEETFDRKTISDVSDYVTFNQAPGKGDTGKIMMSKGMLALQKTNTGSGYGVNVSATINFDKIVEAYSDETRSDLFRNKYKGKYRVEIGFRSNRACHGVMGLSGGGFVLDAGNGAIGINSGGTIKAYGDYSKTYNVSIDMDTANPKSVIISVDGENPQMLNANELSESWALTGMYFGFKSLANSGDIMYVDYVRLYRLEDNADEQAVADAANSLTIDKITPDAECVTSDVNFVPELGGCNIAWESGDIEYISNSGTFMKQSLESDVDVWLKATITKNYNEYIKKFKLTIPKDVNPDHVLKAALSEMDYDDLINGNPNNLSENIKTPSEGPYGTTVTWQSSAPEYVSHDGIVQKYDPDTKKSVTMTATFTYDGVSQSKEFKFMLSVPFEPDYTFFSVDSVSIGDEFTETKDSLTYIYPMFGERRFTPDGIMKLKICVDKDKLSRDGAYFELCDSEGNITSRMTFTPDNFSVSGREANGNDICEIYEYNSDISYVEMVLNYYDNVLKVIPDGTGVSSIDLPQENASSLAYIVTNCPEIITKLELTMPCAEAVSTIMMHGGYLRDIETVGKIVTRDISLPMQAIGHFSISWQSSRPDVLSHSGKLAVNEVSEDTDIILTAVAHMTDRPDVELTREYHLTVNARNYDNLALLKNTTSDVASKSGHFPSGATDGYFHTSWRTHSIETAPSLTVDLGKESFFNSLLIKEADIDGAYNIGKWRVETSVNGNAWTLLYDDETLGESEVALHFDSVTARYIRFVANDPAGIIALAEFQVYSELSDSEKAQQDLKNLRKELGSMHNLTKSVTLPEKGSLYGSKFTYSSSLPSSLSDDGKVTRKSKNAEGTLTITATLNDMSEKLDIPFSVLGDQSSSSSSSGGSSGGFSGVYIPQNSSQTQSPSISMQLFEDVDVSHWAYDYISDLKTRGVVGGSGNGCFYPENKITREEFLKMLIEALNITADEGDYDNYTDVPDGSWYYDYVRIGVLSGIVKGESDSVFGTGKPITRQDMAVMCSRAMQYKEIQVDNGSFAKFTDNAQIAEYAIKEVGYMYSIGIINGYPDGSFIPLGNATRAEASKIIALLAGKE